MFIHEILILTEADLNEKDKDVDFCEVNLLHFNRFNIKEIQYHPVVMYIDRNGNSVILKNRYGNTGIVS